MLILFLGYSSRVKGYKLWSIDDKKAIISQDVVFKEDEFLWIHDLSSTVSIGYNEKHLIQFWVEHPKFDNLVMLMFILR